MLYSLRSSTSLSLWLTTSTGWASREPATGWGWYMRSSSARRSKESVRPLAAAYPERGASGRQRLQDRLAAAQRRGRVDAARHDLRVVVHVEEDLGHALLAQL